MYNCIVKIAKLYPQNVSQSIFHNWNGMNGKSSNMVYSLLFLFIMLQSYHRFIKMIQSETCTGLSLSFAEEVYNMSTYMSVAASSHLKKNDLL